jgi:GNAT superfamily N-acetyltransferase
MHGDLYASEFGYDWTFEALVAEICAHFARNFDAKRERCWIAEQDGSVVGSVFLVKSAATVAKLRLLIVAPEARGNGLGARLVEECIRFAREVGYRKIVLWTQSHLLAARTIYRAKGFRKKGNQPHNSFGKRLVAEVWELKL